MYVAGRLLSALYPGQITETTIRQALDRLWLEAVEEISEDAAYGRRALDRLLDYMAGHREEFEAAAHENAREIVGIRDGNTVWVRAAWLTGRLEKVWGYASKSVYKEWSAEGWIATFDGRHYRQKKVSGTVTQYVQILPAAFGEQT